VKVQGLQRQYDVGGGIEGDLLTARQPEPSGIGDRGRPGTRRVGIDGLGGIAFQAEGDRVERAVTATGCSERALEVDGEVCDLRQIIGAREGTDEARRGAHRTDGV
jgi:hypothetical protein